MATRSALINVMAKAADKAARGLVRDFGEVEQLQVSRKGPADFVSAADRKAEDILRAELQRARPDFGFLMEESGETQGRDGHRWIVDPLDGTTNFLHGLPHWSISIAAEKDGEVLAGVVYDPIRDELFWAEKGGGAFVNHTRLRVSGRRKLEDAVIATGTPFKGRGDSPAFLAQLGAIMPEVAGIRRFGSAALDLAYVAAGRYDGFWETGLAPWDMAAGMLIVSEAGGFVTEINGARDPLGTGSVLAANDQMHLQLLRLLKSAAKPRVAPRPQAPSAG
ncbi:inositol monophosphatase family protein [Arenibaculum pallidiluteum]|uniref:inositol monophosphatase family protein n=1 Tax=Arenibaculum pallidiluteum TaxID=2812559 RepID=UPI001A977902|nr:inositol monophosphatase family protein [Arenibaculum pallidiluteum]